MYVGRAKEVASRGRELSNGRSGNEKCECDCLGGCSNDRKIDEWNSLCHHYLTGECDCVNCLMHNCQHDGDESRDITGKELKRRLTTAKQNNVLSFFRNSNKGKATRREATAATKRH